MRFAVYFFILLPFFLFSQKEEKAKFDSENLLNFKVGATANFTNEKIYKILNYSNTDIFTPFQNINYNPSVDIEFENHFSKYVGLSLGLGFMQTRQHYTYTYNGSSIITNHYETDGRIICNIPHFNLNPSFYIKNTRFFTGLGIYKYYYSFKPMDIGNLSFDLNSEGFSIYSNVGITESFDLKRYKLTLTVNYFGLAKKFDSGLQIALGLAL